MHFFLVYSIYVFRGKKLRNLTLDCCVFYMYHTTFSFYCVLWRAAGYFFLCDCYVLGYHRRSKYNYQKCSTFDTYSNRKFTSDCLV